jgi:hypothetical protein
MQNNPIANTITIQSDRDLFNALILGNLFVLSIIHISVKRILVGKVYSINSDFETV